MRRKVIIFITIVTLLPLLLLSIMFINSPSGSPEPPYFIETRNNEYVISEENGIYYVPTALNNKKTKVPVGNSNVELEDYTNQRIKLELDFPTTKENYKNFLSREQCILDECKEIDPKDGTEYVTVNVLDVEEL